jgi:hypothetical protein
MFAMPSNVAPQSALSLQNACAPGKFAEVFDRGSRICDPVCPNEDAVDAAEKVPGSSASERDGPASTTTLPIAVKSTALESSSCLTICLYRDRDYRMVRVGQILFHGQGKESNP